MTNQQEESQQILMDDDNLVITGPPASRTVIDNLKKLLTQRQHSRECECGESDAENKEVVPSTGSDMESELSFYSLLTSSTSDSDDLDFLRTSTSPDNRKGRRRRKRNLSTSSSSSSSSLSPVRERRKRPKTTKRGVKRYDPQMILLEDWNPQHHNNATSKKATGTTRARHSPISQLSDNADPLTSSANIVNINIMMNPNVNLEDGRPENQSSSNKESATDDEDDQNISNLDTSVRNGGGRATRLRKTRRDRNKRRHRGNKIRRHQHLHHLHHHHHHLHLSSRQLDNNSSSNPSEDKVQNKQPEQVVVTSSPPPVVVESTTTTEQPPQMNDNIPTPAQKSPVVLVEESTPCAEVIQSIIEPEKLFQPTTTTTPEPVEKTTSD